MNDQWHMDLNIEGVTYRVSFARRPFREGCEVKVFEEGSDTPLFTLGELGLGTNATLERIRSEIKKHKSS